MALLNPHFDLPFRLSGTSFACVEQDTHEEIANCVEAILRTPLGWRDDSPDFGLPPQEFTNQPLHVQEISAIVGAQEPRAELLVTTGTDSLDTLIAKLRVQVN